MNFAEEIERIGWGPETPFLFREKEKLYQKKKP